jgi:nucleoside-diphosphate-sugar epimerase
MTERLERWLVTGATGFIGGRLCEYLALGSSVSVRALVHRANTPGTARIARLPVELFEGDLLDPGSLRTAVAGCSVVVHLGLGVGRGIPAGTRNILKAVEGRGLKRFVHVSTVAVHGLNPPAEAAREEVRLRHVGNSYGDEKIRAERLASRAASTGLPLTILRPGIVFGPFGRWTTGTLERFRRGEAVLIDDGRGICNSLYVDNLVHAIRLAAAHPAAVGETFFVTDGEPVTWRQFLLAHAEMLRPVPQFRRMSSNEIREYWRSQPGPLRATVRQVRALLSRGDTLKAVAALPLSRAIIERVAFRLFTDFTKERVKKVLGVPHFPPGGPPPEPPVPDLATLEIETTSVTHRIEKIQDRLGYHPLVTFSEGVRRTAAWARAAGVAE